MINEQQYLEAKKIVEEYEREVFEYNQRKDDEELNLEDDEDEFYNPICNVCGGENMHYRGCPEDDYYG